MYSEDNIRLLDISQWLQYLLGRIQSGAIIVLRRCACGRGTPCIALQLNNSARMKPEKRYRVHPTVTVLSIRSLAIERRKSHSCHWIRPLRNKLTIPIGRSPGSTILNPPNRSIISCPYSSATHCQYASMSLQLLLIPLSVWCPVS